jgi:hypothetical protein
MGQKRGKRRCKSLIIKVFQRSEGLNFTNGTWNKVFGEVECSVSSCFIYIYILYYYYRERRKKVMFQRSSSFEVWWLKSIFVVEWVFALGKQDERTEFFLRSRHYFDFAWNAGTELRNSLI